MENTICIKDDCFACEQRADGKYVCHALTTLVCKTEVCKFYKTREQACRECTYPDCKGCVNPLAES
jgi:hypothetical protein